MILEPAPRAVIEALLQPYLHDFSAWAAPGSPHGEVGEDGRFPGPDLDPYWAEPDHHALLFRAATGIAGFALVNRWSALDLPVDHAVAEFFVLRKHRRAGIGTAAARALFARLPGQWEIPIAGYNRDALPFWRRATEGLGASEARGDGRRWAGPVLRLTAPGRIPSPGSVRTAAACS